MVNLLIEQSARHLRITPNRSVDDSMLQAHNLWLTAIVLVMSFLFLLTGLWPISVMLFLVLLGLLYILLHVAEILKREERLIIDINQLEYRRGSELLISTAFCDASCIYVSFPSSGLDPLKFELVVPERPSLSFAQSISNNDSVILLKTLKKCGLNVIELSSKDQLVKSL
ncbi:MAG: DUF2244 domain-containing protein [Pseudomonadales bacterium]|jgi:hypothetical protein